MLCCILHEAEVRSFEKFKEFEAITTNTSGCRIKRLRTDNGGEYLSKEFMDYLKTRGIQHELTVPHSPEQNGIAERMNRTLMESARSMMAHAGVSNKYWAEAIATGAYLRNRVPSSVIKEGKTPYEQWYGKRPCISHLKVFGCIAYAHIPSVHRQKLDIKSQKLRFFGYSKESKGYRLLDEGSMKVIVRRDVIFNEADFGCSASTESTCKSPLNTIEVDSHVDTEDVEHVDEQESQENRRRSERRRQPPIRYGIDECVDLVTTVENSAQHAAYSIWQITEPKSMEEVQRNDHAKEWKDAADREYHSLMENDTWELTKLPEGRKAIGSKWVFKVKYKSDGTVERFKATFVAKGFAQTCHIWYRL